LKLTTSLSLFFFFFFCNWTLAVIVPIEHPLGRKDRFVSRIGLAFAKCPSRTYSVISLALVKSNQVKFKSNSHCDWRSVNQ
jgi:hypothetical protein